MDGDSPASTVERTFWTVWNYITEAVNRFFRPEPTNVVRNDPNSLQESAIDSKPAKSGHTEGDAIAREGDEEQHLASVSVLSISHATVAWEHCTTDIDLGPDEGSVQHKTQSTGSESKEPEEDEGMREEPFGQTGSDEAEALITECTKENEQEESGVQNTQGQDEAQENDDYEEDVNSTLLSLTRDAGSKYVEESGDKAGAEEETERVMTPDEHQKMDETMTKEEEGDEDEDKQCLEEEDIEVKLCRIKDLSLEEEGNLCIEETRMQRAKVDTAPMLEEVENSDGVLLLASENENKSDEGAKQAENQPSVCEELPADHGDFTGEPILTSLHVELQMACDKSAIVSEDELIVVAQEDAMAHRGESEKVEDAKRKADESTLREQGADFEGESASEAANKQIIYEAPGQEDNIKSVKEDSQEKQISTGHVTCSEEVMQNAQTELHTGECADGHQEDVAKDTEGQTKTETDDVETESHEVIDVKSGMTTRDVSVDESFSDKDKTEEVRLSSEEGSKESYMEVACTTTSVTVKPEGEIRQEISEEFKNISLEMCEGRLVLSRELNSPACEETHEGVPEYNNESGPGENTTQRFLEIGDWKEIPATQLPEEVESKESECLQNSGWSADSLLVREYMEEEQDRTEDIKNSFDLVVEEHTEIVQLTEAGLPQETEKTLVEPVIQESGVLFGEEEANILVASMKTAIEYSEKEFELDVGLTDDTDKTTKELQDGTEELLVEYEIDEGSCESKEADTAGDGHETTGDVAAEEVVTVDTLTFLEAEVHNDREMSFFQASVDAINTDQNSYRTTSLQEVFIKSGFLEEE
ncbi:hypothetical protein GBF38_011856 [Nibea albiflora]|uniref:Uncharacterized protein n=1 Tax=Nibea albiflora TaxID=240163 RepID=A0ACB7F5F1_NIBAL|nr:hypothetical protein GBF38_011856 [Nibea albiflora]